MLRGIMLFAIGLFCTVAAAAGTGEQLATQAFVNSAGFQAFAKHSDPGCLPEPHAVLMDNSGREVYLMIATVPEACEIKAFHGAIITIDGSRVRVKDGAIDETLDRIINTAD